MKEFLLKHKKKIIIGIVCILVFSIAVFYSQVQNAWNRYFLDNEPSELKVDNETYSYNKDLINILCMGIDKKGNINKSAKVGARGQADAIYLVSINKKTNETTILCIPRDTMVDVDICDTDGKVIDQTLQQITLQHAYGASEKQSCEMMANKVSKLLNNIPIQRVVAISYDAIPTINDAVGGVDVTMGDTVDKDLQTWSDEFTPGNTVHLDGEMAYWYLRERDCETYASAQDRANRQMTYIKAFIDQAKSKIKDSPLSAFRIYTSISKEMYTDVSYADMVALLPFVQNIQFDSIYDIPGTRVRGKEYEEFYANEEELVPLITQLYYNKN